MAADKPVTGVEGVAPPRDDSSVLEVQGRIIPNPFQQLENPRSPRSAAWIAAQEARYQQSLIQGSPQEEEFRLTQAQFGEQPQKGVPIKLGANYLFYYRGEGEAHPRVMVSDTPDGAGRTLVDPLKIDPTGNTGVAAYPSPDGKYVACRLRRNDIWESEVQVFDVETGKPLDEKFNAAGTIVWDKDSKGFAYNFRPEPSKSGRVNYAHHQLGQDCAQDPPHYDAVTQEGAAGPHPTYGFHNNHVSYDGPQEFVYWGMGVGTRDLKPGISMKAPGDDYFRVLVEPGTADVSPIADNGDGRIIAWTTEGAEKGRVVLIDPSKPEPAQWQTVIPEGEDALQHAFVHDGRIYGVYLHDSADKLSAFSMTGQHIADVDTGHARLSFAHGQHTGMSFGANCPAQSGELLFSAETYTGTPQAMAYDPKTNHVRRLDGAGGMQLEGCVVETLWAQSHDGTEVPMTVIRREDVKLDGTAALKITGYGGTGCSQTPASDPEMLDFVKAGGIHVVTHIRGGSELGREWHDGGRGGNKENCVEDFNACAKKLVELKYTSPQRMVAQGFSHGGFVVLNAMEREPALYGAVIAGCPVTDPFTRDRTVSSDEFIDPFASAQNRDIALKTSPLHNIQPGAKYPPVMVHSGENDFLLVHALKFVAALQSLCPATPSLLHIEKGYGHSTGRPPETEAVEAGQRRAFVEKAIGPIAQDDWQAGQKLGVTVQATAKPVPVVPR